MIDTISSIVGIAVSGITLITLAFGYVRSLAKIKEGIKAELRSDIEKCYYSHLEEKELKEYERKNLDSLFQAYHEGLKGNSFACDIYNEMREWKIIR